MSRFRKLSQAIWHCQYQIVRAQRHVLGLRKHASQRTVRFTPPLLARPGPLGALQKCTLLAHIQSPFGVQKAVKLDKFGYEPGPAGLMACAKPRAIVAVEILVEIPGQMNPFVWIWHSTQESK